MELAIMNLKRYILEYLPLKKTNHFMKEIQVYKLFRTMVKTLISIRDKDAKN